MKCDCENEMDPIGGFDTCSNEDPSVAYNVYQCNDCGIIKIEHVWHNKRVITIDVNFENKE